MESESAAILTMAVIAVIPLVLVVLSVRIVREHERMVVFRLGRTSPHLVHEPGLRFVIPLIDRSVRVDMREQLVEIPGWSAATRDERTVDIGARIGYRTVDPLAMVLSVADLRASVTARAMGHISELVAELTRDDVRYRREQLVEGLRSRLDEDVEPWGGTITDVVIT